MHKTSDNTNRSTPVAATPAGLRRAATTVLAASAQPTNYMNSYATGWDVLKSG
ncbi:MAG: hypothetical protein ACP5H2_06355 [Solirubrobacteraceae bacterium]